MFELNAEGEKINYDRRDIKESYSNYETAGNNKKDNAGKRCMDGL